MGVSGSGKSTLAGILSDRLAWQVAEGEDFLAPESIAKLQAGRSLREIDRLAWLERIRDWIDRSHANTVITCTALRRSYRDVLRQAGARVMFVHLVAPRDLIEERTLLSSDHFVPRARLDTQLATLEPLEKDEEGVEIAVIHNPTWVASEVLELLGFEL
jgi:gluconokinase